LSIILTNQFTNNGSFTLVDAKLKFTPDDWYGDSSVIDPAGSSYWDQASVRFSDGVNASPIIKVRTSRLYSETKPSGNPDGMPDSWMTTYFGNSDPDVGQNHKANDDADGDGLSNLTEFRLGTNPTDANSALKITGFSSTNLQFIAKPYEVYEIQTSQDFSSWIVATNPVMPIVTNASYSLNPSGSPRFFRVFKVP